jgi:hypothetical protein
MHRSEMVKHCHRCGAVFADTYETVPYAGQGKHVVQLERVHVLRCATCTSMLIELPEPRALDTLIQCLGVEMTDPLPPLTYEMGHWCILPRLSDAHGTKRQHS